MPLNTRSPQKTDKAGAATDGALPKEAERSETAAEPSHGSDAGSEPATESAAPAPGSSAEPGSEPDAASVTETEDEATAARAPEPESGGDSATGRAAKAGTEAGTEADIAQAEAACADTPAATESNAATADPDTPLADTEPGAAAVDADAPASDSVDGRTAAEGDSDAAADGGTDAGRPPGARPRLRRLRDWRADHPVAARVIGVTVTALAGALVVASLLLPNKPDFRPTVFLRIPVEALIGAVVLTALPRRPRLILAWLGGIVLGALTLLSLLDIGFYQYLGRGFNVILDWSLLADAYAYLEDTLGGTGALGALAAVIVLALFIPAVSALSVVRVSNVMARHRAATTRTVLVLSMVWMTFTALGLQVSGMQLASDHIVTLLQARAKNVRTTLHDEREFTRTAQADKFGNTPASQLVPDLRGKDMIFTFIESYGRSAVEDPIMAPGVDKTLDASTKALDRAGFHAKSGWLTSATYGGSSWLGHSTFMSGLWVDNQQRYRTVTASDHLTLTEAFKKTGAWDTVGIMPGVQKGWPEAKWYGLDKVRNAFQLGYRGPKFSWSTMPDQFTLEQFQKLEHSKKRDKPLASFVILTSSHQPWAPIPKMVDWDQLGDGSIFDAIEKAGTKPADVIANSTRSKEGYGESVQYSVTALTQWLERYGNDNTVLVFLGDHQPISRVSGNNASRDVPCSIVAKDPKVLDKIADWGWTDGLRPAHDAPVWKMSSFRDRFLTAYGSTPHPSGH
ncbi:phosphoglycerol transferase MdoB-like AlkP superfamily enzyme [Streptomyces sp. 3212.3]|nr:phosphoglycerol transferase MdoB-like AlkP superfamily enzyme [Streptomyces sp. 3212.3]